MYSAAISSSRLPVTMITGVSGVSWATSRRASRAVSRGIEWSVRTRSGAKLRSASRSAVSVSTRRAAQPMPQLTARDTLRLVAQETPDTPVIIVTGSLDEEIAAEYMKAGATDYVVKHHLERLGPAVQRALDLKRARAEQAQAEEARRQGEERFRALIEHGADAIALLGADGAVLFLRHSAEKLFGFTPSELVGRSALDLLHPDDAPRLQALLVDVAGRRGAPLMIELRLRHRDASWRAVEAVVVNRLGQPALAALGGDVRGILAPQV